MRNLNRMKKLNSQILIKYRSIQVKYIKYRKIQENLLDERRIQEKQEYRSVWEVWRERERARAREREREREKGKEKDRNKKRRERGGGMRPEGDTHTSLIIH